jgi:arginine deiminase
MKWKINAEWDHLRKVAVHSPGIEMYFGLLNPFASLYERSFNSADAVREHEILTDTLKNEFKVKVVHLKDTINHMANESPEIREKLVKLAQKSISYTGDSKEVKRAYNEAEKNRKILDNNFYFNTLLLNPQIELETGKGTRMIHLHVTENEPLTNLYFMRDQQAVTDKGLIISKLAKPQRQRETKLTKFLWNTINVPIVHEIKDPGTFEGGDFLPLKEFALIGMGDRTNMEGIKQMLDHGLNYDEVGVVHQPSHPLLQNNVDPMINMHLDTYINFASDGVAVGCETLLKHADIDLYIREEPGKYLKTNDKLNLYDYLISKDFTIIDITTLEQMAYATNFLCIKKGTILSIYVERIVKDVINSLKVKAEENHSYNALLKQIKKDYKYLCSEGQFFPHKKEIYHNDIDVYTLNLHNLTGGYGGAHCMTCALNRK